jgi:thiamine biosynthesis lipoprotein
MQTYSTEFTAMACENQIVVSASDRDEATHALEAAVLEVRRIERKYSRYRPASESIVARINATAGQPSFVDCDPETLELLTIATRAYELSGGLFDITSGVLRRVWDFKAARIPAEDELAECLAHVGWNKVEVHNASIRLTRAGMEIDFGGFGKEYAADRAAALLKARGLKSGYVNLGGDIAVLGPQQDSSPWLFGIQNPRQRGEIVATIAVAAGGLATSGDYEKFFEKDARRYCHIINPANGMPVNCWSSVSIMHVSALAAGIFSTIAMLKENDAEDFLKASALRYLLLGAQGEVRPQR